MFFFALIFRGMYRFYKEQICEEEKNEKVIIVFNFVFCNQ
jgi:hypothetical protein